MFNTLVNEGFFDENASRIVTNANSGTKVEINESGIEEAFDYNNYQRRGNSLKLLKLATIRKIPQIINEGVLISDDNENYHDNSSNLKYAYIESNVNINEKTYTVKISVRKSLQKNKFWVHHIYINKNTTIDYPVGDNTSKTGLLVNSDNSKLSQNSSNVKHSKDVEDYVMEPLIKQNEKLQKTVEYYKMMMGRNSGHKVNRRNKCALFK